MSSFKALSREPLVHFLLIGAVLFTVFELRQEEGSAAPNRILVDTGQVEQLVARFKRTRLRPPTDIELAALIEGHIREEVYYRQALDMGLDQDDAVMRQRMRQKLEFLLEDLSDQSAPGDEQLIQFMQRHPEKFREEPRLSFTQVFLNPDKHQDLAADAMRLLTRLNNGAPPETEGDRTLLGQEYLLATQHEITRVFGDSFAQQMVLLEPGGWTGPIYSAYGGHLVRVSAKQEERFPELAEIRNQVERDYMAERRQELKDITYRKLREGYEIIIEESAGAAAAVAETTGVASEQPAE
jgi:hypothetical protein